jgi:hypothetical protein
MHEHRLHNAQVVSNMSDAFKSQQRVYEQQVAFGMQTYHHGFVSLCFRRVHQL